jgi:hypothetical protein
MGNVAGVVGLPPEAIDNACSGARISRTVLRSEALRILRAEPIDLMITSSSPAILLSDEFLAAFTASGPMTLLLATRRPDAAAPARFQRVGVRAEYLEFPITEATLRERVHAALQQSARSRAAKPSAPSTPTHNSNPAPAPARPRRQYGETEMASISKSLEEAMKIDGAIAVALADWDSGLCLGTAGGGARLNVEVAAAGNCQVVKAKMAIMSELGIKGAIQDILITLDDQVHLLRPLRRGDTLFLYLAIDKAKGNLGLARHRLQKIESELNV